MACRCWIFRCTKNHIFFFQTSWKDNLSKKNCAEIWSFLYRERWYFFFSKIWSYPLDGKWKMIFLKKWKYDIFFRCSEKMVFPKRPSWNMIFLVLSGKMIFFFSRKHDFFFGLKMKDDLSREIHGNMTPPVRACRCYIRNTTLLCQKRIKDDLPSQKYTQGWLTNWTDILEKVPIILCSFMEIFIGGFIYCFPAKQTQAT